MKKVYPNAPTRETPKLPFPSAAAAVNGGGGGDPTLLTVWRKSLLFNCNGFTVFDASGDLAFRVDSYSAGSKDEIVLMDAGGKSLFTIRRKKLSLADHWLVYDGDETVNPRFSVRKHVSLLPSNALAHVTPCRAAAANRGHASYEIDGSYARRSCTMYGEGRRKLAEIRRKDSASVGADVFCLSVQPALEPPLAMAMVVLLEQMFGSRVSLVKG